MNLLHSLRNVGKNGMKIYNIKKIKLILLSIFMYALLDTGTFIASYAFAVDADAAPTTSSFLISTLTFISLGFLAFYLLIVKPSQLEEDNKTKFLSSIKKGQEVVISGGMIGRVIQVKDKVATIEIAPKIQVRVLSESVTALNNTVGKSTVSQDQAGKLEV